MTSGVESASLLVAWSFAVAAPILDLLGRQPQFFVAHRAAAIEVGMLSVGLTLIVPLALAALVAVLRRAHSPSGAALWWVGVTSLAGAFALLVLRRVPGAGSSAGLAAASLGVALLCGLITALLIRASSLSRNFVLLLTPAPIVLLSFFFLCTPASRLMASSGTITPRGVEIGNAAPIVMLVYDELPLVSLIDGSDPIDSRIFPNFARLAAHSSFYRNATTASDDTTWSIPALLSGLYPQRPGRLPISADHPHTLFTLLQGAYGISCLEPVTRLCPDTATAPAEAEEGASWGSMLSDLRTLWLHLVLPPHFTRPLPPLDQGWARFEDPPDPTVSAAGQPRNALTLEEIMAVANSDRRAPFAHFLETMKRTTEPTLHFGHLLLPHKPYRYLPSGHRYIRTTQPDPFTVGGPWLDPVWAKLHQRQRHQLQTDYVDISLGDLLDRLEATGRYDETLLVVTADHGVAFVKGSDRRVASEETLGEIAWVPLLIKKPYQRQGEVSDRALRLIDVLPLIAETLDIELPWETDGHAPDGAPDVAARRLVSPVGGDFELGNSTVERDRALGRKTALFGRAAGVQRHYQIGADGALVGTSVSELPRGPESRFRARYDRPGELRRVSLEHGGFLPAYLGGDLEPTSETATTRLAAALNGRIAGVGRAARTQGGRTRFAIFLWPELFRDGRNALELFEVTGEGDAAELRSIPQL